MTCPKCLSAYDVTVTKLTEQEKGQFQCVVCGQLVKAWDEKNHYTFALHVMKEILKPSGIAERWFTDSKRDDNGYATIKGLSDLDPFRQGITGQTDLKPGGERKEKDVTSKKGSGDLETVGKREDKGIPNKKGLIDLDSRGKPEI